jgi:hypothetical protein
VKIVEHTVGYQPKLYNRRRFDGECKTAVDEKNFVYKKWIDRPTTSERLQYNRLQKIACKIYKNKKQIQTDNCINKTEDNVKEKSTQRGWLTKCGFKPHIN